MEVIAGMKASDTKLGSLDKMAAEVNLEIKEYNDKYEKLMTDHSETLEQADSLISPTTKTLIQMKQTTQQGTKDS